MGVHLYTNGAWTDSGRIYRNSLNLFDYNASHTPAINSYTYVISDLIPGQQYTCSTNFAYVVSTASIYFGGGNSATDGVWANQPKTKIADSDGTLQLSLRFQADLGAPPVYNDVLNGTIWVMVCKGATVLPYEPYNVVDWYTNTGHGYSSGAWD